MPTFLGPFDFEEIPDELLMRNLVLLKTSISASDETGSFNLGDISLVGNIVVQVFVRVSEAFNGIAELSVGTNFDPNQFLDSSALELSQEGFFIMPIMEELTTASQIKTFFTKGPGNTSGIVDVYLLLGN